MKLKIFEIFYSLQGETSRMGLPTVFVRLTGCPMRCTYCDTAYAFSGGHNMLLEEIMLKVAHYDTPYVTVTGGEPLAQKACLDLLKMLCDAGYKVSLETGGGLPIQAVDQRVSIILDIKTPASHEEKNNLWENLDYIKPQDEIKLVICDRMDYEWAVGQLRNFKLNEKCPVLFSPSYGTLKPEMLAAWVLEDQLPVRMQLQMHKILWGEKQGV